jgi:hypothetical protein
MVAENPRLPSLPVAKNSEILSRIKAPRDRIAMGAQASALTVCRMGLRRVFQ